jgi:cysteine desulfurase
MRTIYLDYNGTTPIAPRVQQAMLPFLAEQYGVASGQYPLGWAAQESIENARFRMAQMLSAQRDEVVFTSGGTESNNWALWGTFLGGEAKSGRALSGDKFSGHLVISALEHASIAEPARWLKSCGVRLSVVPCDARGTIDPDAVLAAMAPDTRLVSVTLANHEVGTLQPVKEIAAICRQRNVRIHTDAAQACGKIPVDVQDLGVDLLTLTGHKMYASKGVGGLYVRRGVALAPLLRGGPEESGRRAGTGNVAAMVGLGEAASLVYGSLDESQKRLGALRERLAGRLLESIPGLMIHGDGTTRLPNTLSVHFPGVAGQDLLRRTPELCAWTGSAGMEGDAEPTATERALGLAPPVARGTVRLSLGWYTDEDEIEQAADLLIAAWEHLKVAKH